MPAGGPLGSSSRGFPRQVGACVPAGAWGSWPPSFSCQVGATAPCFSRPVPLLLPPPPTGSDWLVNRLGLALGVRQSGRAVGDVQLPAWAAGPDDFLGQHRVGGRRGWGCGSGSALHSGRGLSSLRSPCLGTDRCRAPCTSASSRLQPPLRPRLSKTANPTRAPPRLAAPPGPSPFTPRPSRLTCPGTGRPRGALRLRAPARVDRPHLWVQAGRPGGGGRRQCVPRADL
jgi:hypothetical protein